MLFQKLSGRRANNAANNSPASAKTLWSWGYNTGGRGAGSVGDGTVIHRSSPVQLGTLATWMTLAVGVHSYTSMAIKSDNTLWAWGGEGYGALGLGDTIKRSSPTQVGTLGVWSAASNGNNFSVMLKTDGTVWTTGYNNKGRLGVGDVVNRSSPVQVGTLATWSKVSTGRHSGFALKTDGTLWSWGTNTYGVLGLGDGGSAAAAVARSSPVQIGTLSGWSDISGANSTGFGIRSDGTLWSWGYNGRGQLAQRDLVYRSSPTQIGTLTGWSRVFGGAWGASAIRTDGTLWVWGHNAQGQLGIADVVARSSPVQVGTLATWSTMKEGWQNRFALKTDGTIWAWGHNATGANTGGLGLGDAVTRSSPVQIGTLGTWVSIGGSAYYTPQTLKSA